jgi:hypothetical protein
MHGLDLVRLNPGDYTAIDVNMDGMDACASKPGILTRFSREHWFWALVGSLK